MRGAPCGAATLGTHPWCMLLGPTLVLRAALTLVAPEVPEPEPVPTPVPTPTLAAPLEWLAPPECPSARGGAEQLQRFLGERPLSAPARVELVAEGSEHVARVTVDGATRTLRASSCETLARAAALVIAVSLEPVTAAAVVRRERESPPEVPEAPPTVVAPPSVIAPPRRSATIRRADRPSSPEPSAPLRSTHWLGASAGLGLALVPALTGAVRLGYAFERSALRLGVDLTYATPRTIPYPNETSVGGRFQSVVLGVRACFVPGAGRITAPLCGGLEGGPMLGRGIGVIEARDPIGAWLGALAGAAAHVRVHPRLAVLGGADLLLALRRPAFHLEARETLFRAPPVGIRALAGLEVRLR